MNNALATDSLLRKVRGRLALVRVGFVLIFVILAVRAGEVASWPPPPMPSSHIKNTTPKRADIIDSQGIILATDIVSQGLYADPYLIHDKKGTAKALAQILPGTDKKMLEQKLHQDVRFIWIARHITDTQVRAVLEIGEPGLAFREGTQRIYPQGALASHLIGYTNIDGHGLAGAERAFEEDLSKGRAIHLTIDIRLQYALERAIEKAIKTFSAKAGIGAIVEISTGRVLAGASYPDFDPTHASIASEDAKFNRLTLGVYELGSMFKIFSTAAFLETFPNEGVDAQFDVRQAIHRGRFTINDYHPENRILTTSEIFMYSSNIGAALMGEKVGATRLKSFYNALGLLSPLPWALGEVGHPLSPTPWREISTLTAAYGHGIAVSPLQLTMAVAAVMSDGQVRAPLILENQTLKILGRPLSFDTVLEMRELMRLVVKEGTAKAAEVPGYAVGGKTGTAEKPNAYGGYDSQRLISSFVGVFPMHDPQYVILVVIDEPQGIKETYGYATGGWVAAPAVGQVIKAMTDILSIAPQPLKKEVPREPIL